MGVHRPSLPPNPQEAERAFRHMEDLQDTFDFSYKMYYMPGKAAPRGGRHSQRSLHPLKPLPTAAGQDHSHDPQYVQHIQALQAKLQSLDRQRRVSKGRAGPWGWGGTAAVRPQPDPLSLQEVVAQIQQLLGRSETLRDFLQQELSAWRERQQRSCLGAPADTCLLQLQGW